MRLSEIISAQAPLLEEIFDNDTYRVDVADDMVLVRTSWVNLKLVYDLRDRCVWSMAKPLRVPEGISEYHPTDTVLRFLDIEVKERRQSRLDAQQVSDELKRLKPVVQLFKDERGSCDATWFVNGYNAAYTDYCSGKWEPA